MYIEKVLPSFLFARLNDTTFSFTESLQRFFSCNSYYLEHKVYRLWVNTTQGVSCSYSIHTFLLWRFIVIWSDPCDNPKVVCLKSGGADSTRPVLYLVGGREPYMFWRDLLLMSVSWAVSWWALDSWAAVAEPPPVWIIQRIRSSCNSNQPSR